MCYLEALLGRKVATTILALPVLAELGIYAALGPGLAIAFTVACVVTATLLPALLNR